MIYASEILFARVNSLPHSRIYVKVCYLVVKSVTTFMITKVVKILVSVCKKNDKDEVWGPEEFDLEGA